jgi:hypothetical protein
MGNAAASTGAAGPSYWNTDRRKQRVAAAELSVPQDLSEDYEPTGSSGRRGRLRLYSSTSKGRTDPPDGYAGVNRGKRTIRPRGLSGAGSAWQMSQSDARDLGPSFYTPID